MLQIEIRSPDLEKEVNALVDSGLYTVLLTQKHIQTHRPLPIDDAFLKSLPHTLAAGERESMAICKRLNAVFASNERRVKHHCQANGIRCINLAEILRSSWKLEILSQADVIAPNA